MSNFHKSIFPGFYLPVIMWGTFSMIWLSPVSLQATPESQAAVLFLLIEPSARSNGMGYTGTATANEGTAYFNPAGLANQESWSVNFDHQKWLPNYSDMSYKNLVFAVNPGNILGVRVPGVVGFSFSFLDRGGRQRTGEGGEEMGTYKTYDMMTGITYSLFISQGLSIGGTVKYIRSVPGWTGGAGRAQGKVTGSSVALDIGILYQGLLGEGFSSIRKDARILHEERRKRLSNRLLPGYSVGLSLSNVGPKISYIDASQADPLPTNIRLGGALTIDTDLIGIEIATDLYKPLIADGSAFGNLFTSWTDEALGDEFREIDIHCGIEVTGLYLVALRAGKSWDWDGDLKPWTIGFGRMLKLGPENTRFNFSRIFETESWTDGTTMFSLSVSY